MTRGGRRRLFGAGILVALVVSGCGPLVLAEVLNARDARRIAEHNFWPDDLDLSGQHVVHVGAGSSVWHAPLPQYLQAYAPLADLVLRETEGATALAQMQGAEARRFAAVALNESQDSDVPRHEAFSRIVSVGDAPLADIVFVQLDIYEGVQWDDLEAQRRALPRDGRAVLVYRIDSGRWADAGAARLIARMVAATGREAIPFTPVWYAGSFTQDTSPFHDVLSRWVCGGPERADFGQCSHPF